MSKGTLSTTFWLRARPTRDGHIDLNLRLSFPLATLYHSQVVSRLWRDAERGQRVLSLGVKDTVTRPPWLDQLRRAVRTVADGT